MQKHRKALVIVAVNHTPEIEPRVSDSIDRASVCSLFDSVTFSLCLLTLLLMSISFEPLKRKAAEHSGNSQVLDFSFVFRDKWSLHCHEQDRREAMTPCRPPRHCSCVLELPPATSSERGLPLIDSPRLRSFQKFVQANATVGRARGRAHSRSLSACIVGHDGWWTVASTDSRHLQPQSLSPRSQISQPALSLFCFFSSSDTA